MQHIRRLIASEGNSGNFLDEVVALSLQHIDSFLVRTVETAYVTRRFELEWRQWPQLMPYIQAAWERGETLFLEDLVRVTSNPGAKEYCLVQEMPLLTTGSMLAWRQPFLAEEDASLNSGCVRAKTYPMGGYWKMGDMLERVVVIFG